MTGCMILPSMTFDCGRVTVCMQVESKSNKGDSKALCIQRLSLNLTLYKSIPFDEINIALRDIIQG